MSTSSAPQDSSQLRPHEGPVCSPAPAYRRRELAAWLGLLLEGPPVWYRWGGAEDLEAGVDCSGLVVYWARQLGIAAPRWTSGRIWNDLERVEVPEPGDLALYGRGAAGGFQPASHVMIVLGGEASGPWRVAGMSGGGPAVTSLAVAQERQARLRAFDRHTYRSDFLGFARLPFEPAGAA